MCELLLHEWLWSNEWTASIVACLEKMNVVDSTTWYVFVAVENEYCTSYSSCKRRKSLRLAKIRIWDKKENQFVGISEFGEG